MSQILLQHVGSASVQTERPDLKPGHVVRVHQRIKEGEKERVQIFEGLVISLNAGAKADKTFTVRKVVEGVGVEKVFPLYSKMIEKIELVKQGKVRRSKLYYMRDLQGKSTRLRDENLSEEDKKFLKGAQKKEAASVAQPEAASVIEPEVTTEEAPITEEAAEAESSETQAEPEVSETPATDTIDK